MAPYTGNSIVDYLKSSGQASDFGSRTALATKSGIKGYSGTAEQNSTLLNTLNASATNPKDAYTASLTTGNSNSNSGTPTDTSGSTTTTTNDPFSSYRTYLSSYADSLKENPDVTAARTKLTEIQNSEDQQNLDARKAYEDLIHTSGMLRGGAEKAGSVSNRNNSYILGNLGVAESGAARKLGALTDSANAKSTYLKTAAELSKPIQLGDKYYDPATGKEIPNTKDKAGFELSAGQSRYEVNPETGKYEKIASVAPTPSTAGVTRSGGLTYTPAAAAEDSKALEASRGDDGYVDPNIYQRLYKAWVASGGLLKDFLSAYPPKDYVNPANTNLPKFLMPSTTVINPYE